MSCELQCVNLRRLKLHVLCVASCVRGFVMHAGMRVFKSKQQHCRSLNQLQVGLRQWRVVWSAALTGAVVQSVGLLSTCVYLCLVRCVV
jgi:hypothetical protein